MQDIQLPEVAALQQRARFFEKDGVNKVEISAVGSKDTIVKKVGPDEMAKFKAEWDAFCDGKPLVRRPGTALTDIPGVDQTRADHYIGRNIHTAEELASLSDGQCQAVGHGTLTDRKSAISMISMRRLKQDSARHDAVGKAFASVKEAAQPKSEELGEIGRKIDALADGINALVAALTPKKPGRPKKDQDNAAG